MLTVNVICVGKLKEKFYLAAVEEYSKRLGRSCKLNLLELPEERLPENPSDAQIEAALRKEFQLIQSKLPPRAAWSSPCVLRARRSPARLWPKKFNDWAVGGASQLYFPDRQFLRTAPGGQGTGRLQTVHVPMTFPHHLARVMLLEQIYRAPFKINEGSRYLLQIK